MPIKPVTPDSISKDRPMLDQEKNLFTLLE